MEEEERLKPPLTIDHRMEKKAELKAGKCTCVLSDA